MIKKILEDKYFLVMVIFQFALTIGILYLMCFVEESVSKIEVNVNSENAKYLGGLWMFVAGALARAWLGSDK